MDFENDLSTLMEAEGWLEQAGLPDSDLYVPAGGTGKSRAAWVQESLNRVMGAGLVVDGVFGPQTRQAVRLFQRRTGLVVDGVVGPRTEKALVKAGASQPPNRRPSGGAAPGPLPAPRPSGGTATLAALNSFSRWFARDFIARGKIVDCADLAIELWINFGERYGVPVRFEKRDSGKVTLINRQGVFSRTTGTRERSFGTMDDFVRYAQGWLRARDLIYNTTGVPGGHHSAVAGDLYLWEYIHRVTGVKYSMGHTQIIDLVTRSGSDPRNDTVVVVQGNYPASKPEFRTREAVKYTTPFDIQLSGGPHTGMPVLPAPRRFNGFIGLR